MVTPETLSSVLKARQSLGKYRIVKRLAEGGFANVYDAYDTIEGLHVALKVPTEQKEASRAEYIREVRLTATLEHPNILGVKNAGLVDNKFVIAYRLGQESLADRLTRRIAARTALRIAEDILSAVAHAHQHRIIHRDIKPENVILLDDGRACLTDFGIAKLALRTRTVGHDGPGTYGYMAPEHALGKPSFRSDVFSVGLVLWRLFGGTLPEWPFRWPFPGHGRIRRQYGAELTGVLQKALSLDERKRYANGGAMLEAFLAAKRRRSVRGRRRNNGDKPEPRWRSQRDREFKRLAAHQLGSFSYCPHCSGPIGEALAHCPWCASRLDHYAGPTKYPARCKRCHRGVRKDWTFCAWCYGGKINPDSSEVLERPTCRRCANPECRQRSIPYFGRYCPACRSKAAPPRELLKGAQRCKSCGWGVFPSFWDYCPSCGKAPNSGGR